MNFSLTTCISTAHLTEPESSLCAFETFTWAPEVFSCARERSGERSGLTGGLPATWCISACYWEMIVTGQELVVLKFNLRLPTPTHVSRKKTLVSFEKNWTQVISEEPDVSIAEAPLQKGPITFGTLIPLTDRRPASKCVTLCLRVRIRESEIKTGDLLFLFFNSQILIHFNTG